MKTEIKDLLEGVRDGSVSVDEALQKLKMAPYEDLGFAKIDTHRAVRQGAAEVIYGAGKTPEQIVQIATRMKAAGQERILITRLSEEKCALLPAELGVRYVKEARIGFLGDLPVMRTEAIGYGMGTKDFPIANCLRAMLGETADRTENGSELACNVDDMTAEEISFAMERLFEGGAFEVYTVPIGMKKSRPGTLMRVMCAPDKVEEMVRLIYRYTSTIGVRETVTKRFVLDRAIRTVDTPYGPVRVKESTGYGVTRRKLEYDDVAKIAKEQEKSVSEIRAELSRLI